MDIDNGFELIVVVVFAMINELRGLGLKDQDLVISFGFDKVEYLSQFHLRYLQARRKFYLLNDEMEQTNKQTNKQTINQTNKQTNKQINNQTNKQSSKQASKQTNK